MYNDGRCISTSSLHFISTSSTEEWKKLCCSLLTFLKLPDYHDNSKFLFNPLTYVLMGWGFSPAAEKAIGWGRVIERLHGRAAIGSWNLLICLHQSLPVRWLWHSAKSMLLILSWQSPRPNMSLKNFNASFLSPSRGKQNKDKINLIFFCLFLVYWKWSLWVVNWLWAVWSSFVLSHLVSFLSIFGYYCFYMVSTRSAEAWTAGLCHQCGLQMSSFDVSNPPLSPFLSIYK